MMSSTTLLSSSWYRKATTPFLYLPRYIPATFSVSLSLSISLFYLSPHPLWRKPGPQDRTSQSFLMELTIWLFTGVLVPYLPLSFCCAPCSATYSLPSKGMYIEGGSAALLWRIVDACLCSSLERNYTLMKWCYPSSYLDVRLTTNKKCRT